MEKWYAIPPYCGEKWEILQQAGELVATCENRTICEKIVDCFNNNTKLPFTVLEIQRLGSCVQINEFGTNLKMAIFEDIDDAKNVFSNIKNIKQ